MDLAEFFFTHSESIVNQIVMHKADSTARETASLTYRNAKENPHQSVDILTVLQLYLINRTSLEAARAAWPSTARCHCLARPWPGDTYSLWPSAAKATRHNDDNGRRRSERRHGQLPREEIDAALSAAAQRLALQHRHWKREAPSADAQTGFAAAANGQGEASNWRGRVKSLNWVFGPFQWGTVLLGKLRVKLEVRAAGGRGFQQSATNSVNLWTGMLYRYTVLAQGIKEQLETRVAVAEQRGQGWAWLSADRDRFIIHRSAPQNLRTAWSHLGGWGRGFF